MCATIGDQVWSPEDSMRIIINSTFMINNIIILIIDCVTIDDQVWPPSNSTMFMILDCKMVDITIKVQINLVLLGFEEDRKNPEHEHCRRKEPQQSSWNPQITWVAPKRGQPSLSGNEILNLSPIRSPKGFRPKPCKKSIWDTEIMFHWKHFSLAILQSENKNGKRKFRDKYLWDGHDRHGGGSEADGEESQENLRWSNLFEFDHDNMTEYRCDNVTRWQVKKYNMTTFSYLIFVTDPTDISV